MNMIKYSSFTFKKREIVLWVETPLTSKSHWGFAAPGLIPIALPHTEAAKARAHAKRRITIYPAMPLHS